MPAAEKGSRQVRPAPPEAGDKAAAIDGAQLGGRAGVECGGVARQYVRFAERLWLAYLEETHR